MKKTKMLSICSLMAAMCVAILSIGSLFESLDVTLAIVAGLVVLLIDTEYGFRPGLAVFLVAGSLSLLLPMKTPAVLFLAFGGWYPLVQKKINMLPAIWALLLKLVLFNAVLAALLWLSAFVTGVKDATWVVVLLFVVGNICFYMYDILLDRFMLWYILKFRSRLKF